MEINKELIWPWYIFENHTLQETHHLLATKLHQDSSLNHIHQGTTYPSRTIIGVIQILTSTIEILIWNPIYLLFQVFASWKEVYSCGNFEKISL